MSSQTVTLLDVCEDIRRGGEPFTKIMNTVARIRARGFAGEPRSKMMAASSPKSAAANATDQPRKPIRPTAAPNLAGFQTTSVRMPLCFVLAGLLSPLVSAGLLLAQPELLAMHLTHRICSPSRTYLCWVSSALLSWVLCINSCR